MTTTERDLSAGTEKTENNSPHFGATPPFWVVEGGGSSGMGKVKRTFSSNRPPIKVPKKVLSSRSLYQ